MAPFDQTALQLPGPPPPPHQQQLPGGDTSAVGSGGMLSSIDAQSSFMRERAAQRSSELQHINVRPTPCTLYVIRWLVLPLGCGDARTQLLVGPGTGLRMGGALAWPPNAEAESLTSLSHLWR